MADMASNGSAGAFHGFSVFQPALGSALQWLPAVGTQELDDLVNAFLPGPASIQDKRTHISMDFFAFSRQTGENFKFYPVPAASFSSVAIASPATSSSFQDSGYDSSFNTSPILSDVTSWVQSPASFAASSFEDARAKAGASVSSKKSTASSSRQQPVDFAHHPGMRIMTKDGRDVTNSASRGCKSKEQRDHAHLMRIIKACDSCKRKKVRCDPSHKKRSASQASSTPSEPKTTKKARKSETPPPAIAAAPEPVFSVADFELPETFDFSSLDAAYPATLDESWDKYFMFDPESLAVSATPTTNDLGHYDDFLGFLTPSTGSSSTSPLPQASPFTPIASGPSPVVSTDVTADLGFDALQEAQLPYLNPGVAHGTNYVDFNLFSPASSFIDEEPITLKKGSSSSSQRQRSSGDQAQQGVTSGGLQTPESVSVPAHTEASSSPSWSHDIFARSPTQLESRSPSSQASPRSSGWSDPILQQYYDPGSGYAEREGADQRQQQQRQQLVVGGAEPVGLGVVSDAGSPRARSSSPRLPQLPAPASDVVGSPHTPPPCVPGAPRAVIRRSGLERVYVLVSPVSPAGLSPLSQQSTVVALAGQQSVSPRVPAGVLPLSTSSQGSDVIAHALGQQPYDGCRPNAAAYAVGLSTGVSSLVNGTLDKLAAGQLVTNKSGFLHDSSALRAVSTKTTQTPTLPTRCFSAGEALRPFIQLVVFGLVSFLCSTLQTRLGEQSTLLNILAIASLSLASLASRHPAAPSRPPNLVAAEGDWVAKPCDTIDNVKTKIQRFDRSVQDLRSVVSRRSRTSVPCLGLVGSFRF